MAKGKAWEEVFPGVASIDFSREGKGAQISLRITKKEGIPVQVVPEGTPGASVVAVKRVNELDYYNLGHSKVAEHLGLSPNKTSALIWHLGLQRDPDCFKEIAIGKSKFKRYSQKGITAMKDALKAESIDAIWEQYKTKYLQGRKQ